MNYFEYESNNVDHIHVLKRYDFEIGGNDSYSGEDRLIYFFKTRFICDFLLCGNLRAIVMRQDIANDAFKNDQISCAKSMGCMISERTHKNEEEFAISLTEGSYSLFLIDY